MPYAYSLIYKSQEARDSALFPAVSLAPGTEQVFNKYLLNE